MLCFAALLRGILALLSQLASLAGQPGSFLG
jgi:hypothetical protein